MQEKAKTWIRQNLRPKGKKNLNAKLFRDWVIKEILNGRKIHVSTAKRWLRKLGFKRGAYSKGAYYDGHERKDVVERRNIYLRVKKQQDEVMLHSVQQRRFCRSSHYLVLFH